VNAASGSPACQDPIVRSPDAVISHTVPSSSTRPKRCGSLAGGAVTVGAGRPGPGAGRAGPGRGIGRGPGVGIGRGAGVSAGASLTSEMPPGSLLVIFVPRTIPRGVPRTAAQRGAFSGLLSEQKR
jgi:hypothetical protein